MPSSRKNSIKFNRGASDGQCFAQEWRKLSRAKWKVVAPRGQSPTRPEWWSKKCSHRSWCLVSGHRPCNWPGLAQRPSRHFPFATSSRATVGNRVRPKNSLRSRTSWGTQPRRQETLGQRSHPNFRKGSLNGAVVNSSLLSEKHCHVIGAGLRLTLLVTVTYDGMSFGSTIARINLPSPQQWTSVTRENLNDIS
jgi:hypothetical protein